MLPDDVETAANVVATWIKDRNRNWRTLYNVPLNAFVEPHELSTRERGITKPQEKAAWNGIVSIALVYGTEDSFIRIALISEHEQYGKATTSILRRLGVPTFCGDLFDSNEIRRFLDQEISFGLNELQSSERSVTNRAEKWLIKQCGYAIGISIRPEVWRTIEIESEINEFREWSTNRAKKYRIYHEMSLGKILQAANSSIKWTDPDHFSLMKSRCDTLIASAPPRSQPLIVVEFDGAKHSEPKQLAKDLKRDEILTAAGLIVIRISSKNPGVCGVDWKHEDIIEIESVRLRELTEKYATFIVSSIISDLELLEDNERKERELISRHLLNAKNRLSKMQRERARIIGKAERAEVFKAHLQEA